jgi:glutamate 5-kinase
MSTKIVAARLATSAGVTTVITRSSNPGNIANIVRYVQSLKTAASTPRSGTPRSGTPRSGTPRSGTPRSGTPPIGKPISSPTSASAFEEPLSRSTASLIGRPQLTVPLHTRFTPYSHPIRDRYFWLQYGLAPHGTVYIDVGAHRALENKAGLLPVGVVDVEGTFSQQEAVRLVVVDRLSSPSPVNGKMWVGPGVEVGRALVNYSATEIMRIKGVKSDGIEALLGYAETEYVALRENISYFNKLESRPVTPSLEIQIL